MRPAILLLAAVSWVLCPGGVGAQTLQQRVDDVRQRQVSRHAEAAHAERASRQAVAARMGAPMERLELNASFRDALNWWSNASGIPLIVSWRAMEREGVDPDAPVRLDLTTVPAGKALWMILQVGQPEARLHWEVEAGYVHLMTREEANRMAVIAVFDVSDLLMEVPNFGNAPRFDLGAALENRSSGGTGGGGGSNLFSDQRTQEERPTRASRGEALAQLIRDTVEPEIWTENGGIYGHSVRYWNGRLIVRAPKYVVRQIGMPTMTRRASPVVSQ